MLVRRPGDGTEQAIGQEHHALLSGLLAGAWRPALDPRLVAAITLHDNPWRAADATPAHDAEGRIIDFVAYPLDERLSLYRTGITELEQVDPYIAHLVSLHYTSFAGLRGVDSFQTAERARRERLAPLLGARFLPRAQADLTWMQFFDVFSLHVCLTGPDVPEANLPIWLRSPERWTTAPDGAALTLNWVQQDVLTVSPWPFAGPVLELELLLHGAHGPRVRALQLVPG